MDTKSRITEIEMHKRIENGKGAMMRIQITPSAINAGPTVIEDMIDQGVKQLREFLEQQPPKIEDNPSSRWYG